MANTFYALPNINFVSNPYNYIFKFFNDAKFCLSTLQGIYSFINQWSNILHNVMIDELYILHQYNVFSHDDITPSTKMCEFILQYVSNQIHFQVSPIHRFCQDSNIWIVLPFVISTVFSDIYEKNNSFNLTVMYLWTNDKDIPINSFDIIQYLDILWGHTDDMYFGKWGIYNMYDIWLESFQMNYVGSQILNHIASVIQKYINKIQKYNEIKNTDCKVSK